MQQQMLILVTSTQVLATYFSLSQGDTIYLLYAYHPMDPTGDNDILQHEFRQSMIISLFGSIVEPPEPTDATYLDVLTDSVCSKIYRLLRHFC